MTEEPEIWTVPPHAPPARLDHFLQEVLPGLSRSQIQLSIREGLVRVNSREVKTGYRLRQGDIITYRSLSPAPLWPKAENIPLHVMFEDSCLAVIEKPAGMVCHLGAGVRSGTLVNALLYRWGALETGDPARPGIVHRLDKSTSGVMVIAKNPLCHRVLSQQFKSREVKKEYLALVYGHPDPPAGTIDQPLGRDPHNRKKISVRARKTRSAVTHYRVLREYPQLSLLSVRIETGRTHQIRVHLAQKGHPVVGDNLYGGARTSNLADSLRLTVEGAHRVFLHSHRLSFRHPTSGEALIFSSPLPAQFRNVLLLLDPEQQIESLLTDT